MEKLKPMYNPPHPGGFIKRQYLEFLSWSIIEFAGKLGITSEALEDVLEEKSSVTADIAERLEKTIDISAELWLNMQRQRDNWLIKLKTEAQTKTLEKELAY